MLTKLYVMVSVYLASLKNEEGQGMAEYGLILALIAVVLVTALTTLKDDIAGIFTSVGEQIPGG